MFKIVVIKVNRAWECLEELSDNFRLGDLILNRKMWCVGTTTRKPN